MIRITSFTFISFLDFRFLYCPTSSNVSATQRFSLSYCLCVFDITYAHFTSLSTFFFSFLLLISYARVMGQMAILTMSFLTFPVAHNSVWESVFGVPFDRSEIIHVTISFAFDFKILMCNI